MQQSHMTRDGNPFLVVKPPNQGMPPLGYKIFLCAVCSSLRDYSEEFNHGCFIGTTDELDLFGAEGELPGAAPANAQGVNIPLGFIEALVKGGSPTDILSRFRYYGFNDFDQNNSN